MSCAVAAGVGYGERRARSASARLFSSTRDRAHRGDLARRPEVGARASRRRCRAQPSCAASAPPSSPALDQLHPAELAHRLEHPVAHRAARVEHGEQRLVDQRLDLVEGVVAQHGVGAVQREAVVEDREPAQRAALVLGEQVPRPVDDRDQGLVPVRGAAVAAAQQGEPVVEPAVDVLDRHHPHLGRRQLDGQRQPVEAAHDAGVRRRRRARRPAGRPRPAGRTGRPRRRRRAGRAGRPVRRRSRAARGSW